MEKLKGYERYQLEWMIEHGYSLEDLMGRLTEIHNELADNAVSLNPKEIFNIFEYESGFKESEIWACEDEWEDNDKEECIYYNVGFINDLGKEDETQFDIPAIAGQTEAIEELMDLFYHFCEENNIDKPYITYIDESEQ